MNFNALSSEFPFSIVTIIKVYTFERSLIFKFKILAILKFDCPKFQPSPNFTEFLIIPNKSIIILLVNYLENRLHFQTRNFWNF